jgi:hypothetical protein
MRTILRQPVRATEPGHKQSGAGEQRDPA